MLSISIFASLLVLATLHLASGDLVKLSSCSVQLEDGSIVDLSSLSDPSNPMHASINDYDFFYNPCDPIDCSPATNTTAAFCQKSSDQQTAYEVGSQNIVFFQSGGEDVSVYLSSLSYDGAKKGIMGCICSEQENLTFESENPMNVYHFKLHSKCCCPNGCTAKGPRKLSACSVQLDDGSVIDLSSLDNPNSPKHSQDDQFMYTFNPCSPLSCGQYNDSGICQTFKGASQDKFDLGDQSSVSFAMDSFNLVIKYQSITDKTRNSYVKCICSPMESFVMRNETPVLTYNFEFSSPCCCPNGCKSGPKKLSSCSAQLADGSIIDLSSLDDASNPRSVVTTDPTYTYFFNPCSPIKCTDDPLSGVCQYSLSLNKYFDLGNQDTVSYSISSNNNLVLTYQASEGPFTRTTDIECVCHKEEYFSFVSENPQRHYSFLFASPCCCPDGCSGGEVKKLGPCTAQLANGSVFDLSSLDLPRTPRESDMGDYKYFFNPCTPIECENDDTDSAFCQKSEDGKTEFSLGDQHTSTFKFNAKDNFLVVQYKSSYRTSNLVCVCAETEQFSFINEYPALNYTFVLYSPCCCADGCATLEPPKKTGSCQAQYSDGSKIDLSSLDNPNSPLQANTRDYSYFFNPCSQLAYPSFCSSLSPQIAGCQVGTTGTFDIADQNVDFQLDSDSTLLMVYKSSIRTTRIRCVCDRQNLGFHFIEESPMRTYTFELQSECCCKNGC